MLFFGSRERVRRRRSDKEARRVEWLKRHGYEDWDDFYHKSFPNLYPRPAMPQPPKWREVLDRWLRQRRDLAYLKFVDSRDLSREKIQRQVMSRPDICGH